MICGELKSYRCMVFYRCKHLRYLRAQDITPRKSGNLWIILSCGDVVEVKNHTPIGDLGIILWAAYDENLIDTILSR